MQDTMTPAERAARDRFEQDTAPVILPVLPGTWLSAKKMGLNIDVGRYEFIDEGTHIWESFFRHWGWWKTVVLGWYPYTDLRDSYLHDKQGIGRPWLRVLSEEWQTLIFREFVLLIQEWNSLVRPEHRQGFLPEEEFHPWMERWLSLTNTSWKQGLAELERAVYEDAKPEVTPADVARLLSRYQHSASTWRPMMPEKAIFHQKYADRSAYWTFEGE